MALFSLSSFLEKGPLETSYAFEDILGNVRVNDDLSPQLFLILPFPPANSWRSQEKRWRTNLCAFYTSSTIPHLPSRFRQRFSYGVIVLHLNVGIALHQ